MDEKMKPVSYSEPVAQLLTLGEASGYRCPWEDYSALGLTASDVPELIRMATDESLNDAESDSLLVWAPVHAWRALGQLRAESAIEPLLGLLHRVDDGDDDWIGEDMPEVMGLIGPAALPALSAYLRDASHGLWARIAAGECLGNIGSAHPDARDTCVSLLTSQLERFTENDEDLNAFIIASLVDLNAVESAPVMERAFAANAVELSVLGDWQDVQIELGLLDMRITPRWRLVRPSSLNPFSNRGEQDNDGGLRQQPPPPQHHNASAKTKKKKKAQKQARKKNRRK